MNEMKNPIAWFEIYVNDLKRAKKFYENTFLTSLNPMPMPGMDIEMLAFEHNPDQYGITGALVKDAMRKPSTEGNLVYFSCQDCAVTADLAVKQGGKIFLPKFSIGEHGFCAIIGDTEGNAIGLYSMA